MKLTGKEVAERLNGISSFGVEIGNKKDPKLARRQEATIMKNEDFREAFSDFYIQGIEKWYEENHGSRISNKEESKYGDIVLLDDNRDPACFLEVKVGTKAPNGKGPYFGGPSLTTICNKLKGMKADGIPRVVLCIADTQDFCICDPKKMLKWLLDDSDGKAFLVYSRDEEDEPWENEWVKMFQGKIRVGNSNATASKNNRLHAKDYFPSFPFARRLFEF